MNDHPDPFDLLASLRDHVDRPLEVDENPRAEQMLREITSRVPEITESRLSVFGVNLRTWLAGLLTVSVLGVGAVAAAAWLRHPADATTLSCYSAASIPPPIQAEAKIDPALTPEQQCEPLWRDGTISTDGAPTLVACVTDNEITAVMPGTASTCSDLGFAVRDVPRPSDQLDALVSSKVPDLFLDGCIPDLEIARDRVSALLDELGADEWSIRIEGKIDSVRRCAGPFIDGARHEILIVAHPG